MGVVYDELLIATMKEMNVCRKAIMRLSKALADMEIKYDMSTAEFIERFTDGRMGDGKDYVKWHNSFAGLKNWEQRLREFEQILRDGTGAA
jgi:hypothetical protein